MLLTLAIVTLFALLIANCFWAAYELTSGSWDVYDVLPVLALAALTGTYRIAARAQRDEITSARNVVQSRET